MNRINYKIEDFEGPLDLLLVLISKNKMSIADVEIITIINQYLAVINAADQQDLDTASEFIDMAARLIYLKSVYLLPKDDEGEKLKAELQGQLIEYSQAKKAANMLRSRFIGDKIFLRQPMELKVDYTHTHIH
ncbi:MAG: segregation/condensation protein A, partial [Oscillospiraceae bacterium]|nr:segregation/condensation protein A [Oscillospiraceae bacterium]